MYKFLTLLTLITALLTGAEAQDTRKLVIKGSDTLGAKLVPQLAEAFKALHPGVTFEIAAEGSTTGIAAITDGTADIGMSSRKAKAEELATAAAKGVNMNPITVCFDGLAVIVNEDNPIESLTPQQVEEIFTGDVEDFSAVGGPVGALSIYTRNTASGTYQDWKELAMSKRDYAPSSQKMAGHEQIAAEVGKNLLGVGYVGIAYINNPGVKVVPIETEDGLMLPTKEHVTDHKFPYARPNFFYTKGEPTGVAKDFIDFTLSPAGSKIVDQVGFVSVAH